MGEYNIQQKQFISAYRSSHQVPVILNDDAVVEMIKKEMIESGKVYPEFASLLDKGGSGKTKKKVSVFEKMNTQTDFVSDRLEKTTQTKKTNQKKSYTPQEKAIARKYIAEMLKNKIYEAIYGEQGFNVIANPNKISGSEAWQEIEVLGASIVHNLNLGHLGIEEPLNRKDLSKSLNIAFRRIAELETLVDNPEKFDKKYKEITWGKEMDYSAVIDYMKAVNEHQSSYIQDKLSTLEKLKEPAEKFEKTLNIPAVTNYNKWAGRQETAGSLSGLAIDIALAYMSGGMAAASNAAMKVGQGVTKAVTEQAVKTGMKREAAEITGQVAGITTSQVTGAGLNSAIFQTTRIAGALEDGNFTAQEFDEIGASYIGLFKFGYVGSAISGPMGAKFGEWAGRLINNEKTVSAIINSSLNKPTTLGKLLTSLSEHTGIIQKATEFGTSFVINTEYMAQDEGISFEEALTNLAQMEGVSKMVMAFLGGKTTKFLTPEKVQKITTEIENCKVEIAVYRGQKAIKVTTPEGKENFFASHEELIAFVADRVYTEAGIGVNGGENLSDNPIPTKGEDKRSAKTISEPAKNGNQTSTQVKLSEIKSWEDIEKNKNNLGKDFSTVQMEILKQYVSNDMGELIPERLAVIEKMLKSQTITSDEIAKLLTSDKIPQEELLKIDEYEKLAREQGFDLVKLMESTEKDFDNYIEQETQRINEGRPYTKEQTSGITVTDSKSSLFEQIKNNANWSTYDLKQFKSNLKEYSKEEVKKLSELLSAEKYFKYIRGYYDMQEYTDAVKNIHGTDFELLKQCMKAEFTLRYGKDLIATVDNNPARREVALELLKLHSQLKLIKTNYALHNNNIIFNSGYWNYILKDIKTAEQKDAYLLYLKSVRLEEISDNSRTQPNMHYINNVDEMQAWLEIKDYTYSVHREEFRKLYIKLSPEDRKLFTQKQFQNENQWNNGFSTHIDIMKLLIDPNFDSGYKAEIREFLKENPDVNMVYKFKKAVDVSGPEPVFNIEHFRRIKKFAKTGVEYDQYRFNDLTEGYLKEDGTFEYAYDNEYIDKWHKVLTEEAEIKTLGRKFTMEEAKDFSYIEENWKKDYVIRNLKAGMTEYEIRSLCQDVIYNIKNKEQLRLNDVISKYKDGIPTTDGNPIKFDYNLYRYMTEKTDIDAFCRVFDGKPLTRVRASLYANMIGTNFAKKVKLIEDTPTLSKLLEKEKNNYMDYEHVLKYVSEFGEQTMLLLDRFAEAHPELSEKMRSFIRIRSSGRYECKLTEIKSPEMVERVRKNLEIIDKMSPEDIEILKEIAVDEIFWTHETDFAQLITNCDFSKEKFDILKPLYLKDREENNKHKFATIMQHEYDIDILKEAAKRSRNMEELASAMGSLEGGEPELVKTLMAETDFNLDMVIDVVRQDNNLPDKPNNTIEEVKKLAKSYKTKSISRDEAFVMMLNIKEVTLDLAQTILAKADRAEIEYIESNRAENPQRDYKYNDMHMLYYAKKLARLTTETNKELVNTLLIDSYFSANKIETICRKKYIFEDIEYWSPEKDMAKAVDIAKNYKQNGMSSEEAYVMLLNVPAMTKTLAQKVITKVKAEETAKARKENRELKEKVIYEQIEKAAREVHPETTELAEILYEDANLNTKKIKDIINYKNDGYNSQSAVSQITEIAKTYKQKGIDKTKAYLMMLNPFSITERMAEKVLKQVAKDVDSRRKTNETSTNNQPDVQDNSIYEYGAISLVRKISADRAELAEYLLDTPEWNENTNKIARVLDDTKNAHEVLDLCKNYNKYELLQEQVIQIVESKGELSAKDLSKLNKLFGRQKVLNMTPTDRNTAAKFVDVIDVQNINEITIGGKKKLLRALVDNRDGSFHISEELRERLPIIPRNVDEYCPLLRSIVRAIGIETEPLTPAQRLQMFNSSMKDLSKSLAELSDKDFAELNITLEQPREEFIEIVKEKIKDLSDMEKRKVFDYYGFEFHKNKNNPTGYSITGYPVNLNNGQKLALIENPQTKAVVEALRPDVIRFSKQNKIKCNNPQIETLLNAVLDGLPEIRTMVGKAQHHSHDFDVMQHSLKVMQKLAQNPNFEKLPESDKKIMLLASLLHDITKGEGYSDKTHATESSFDAFYIAQKFNLSKDDVLKLYTLIEHHEWLGYVNTKRDPQSLTKALQNTAFYLQNDNLFELALMFTHADLKAVKKDNSFHDKTEGPSRINFRGEVHSFGEAADIHAKRIREYINWLKANKPFTPTTRVPKMSAIKSRIGSVDPDGKVRDKAGNIIKGLHVRESDGLVIIKHNEVTDWEAIGFSKGTTSKGITGVGKIRDTRGPEAVIDEAPYETGNVHYFMHGLDYANQLMKFEAFTQPDSKVMLSVTYLERPETKPRGFRAQGVLLRFRDKYVYGGGETDSGSGCGKFVDKFIDQYCFGGEREKDRTMVSELHKKSTGMGDEEYIKFIEEHQNKEWSQIEPIEVRNKMIKGLADGIISTGRRHDRAYDEFYASNPDEVEATFAYEEHIDATIDNPIEFVNKNDYRLDYLIRFSLDHDIPMILLGE